MKRLTAIPLIVSSLRIGVLPIIIFFYATGDVDLSLAVFAFAAVTDLMDGYLARKMGVTSKFGAYYDGATDFVLVTGIYAFLISKAIYPIWLLLLITASFGQFLVSSLYTRKLYDPIGRYTGSALYLGIVLTLVFPTQAVFDFVQFAFIGFFVVSLASRALSLAGKNLTILTNDQKE